MARVRSEKSFIGEHTAEFVVVPRIQTLLSKQFQVIVPLAYWKSREGSSVAIRVNAGRPFRVCAVFPRRPKVLLDESAIFGKLNEQLFRFAAAAQSAGIPTFAGCPVASSLWELSPDASVIWFALHGRAGGDVTFRICRKTLRCDLNTINDQSAQVISESDILPRVTQYARVYDWDSAVESIDSIRRAQLGDEVWRFAFGARAYKPVYFILGEAIDGDR